MPGAMEPAERDFWIALGLWGSAAVTVFGAGLFALFEDSYWFGGFYVFLGGGAILYVSFHLKGKRLAIRPAIIVSALAVTWILFGWNIYIYSNRTAFKTTASTGESRSSGGSQYLNTEQRQILLSKLNPGPASFRVRIVAGGGCEDCYEYMKELMDVFKQIPGWKVDGGQSVFALESDERGIELRMDGANPSLCARLIGLALNAAKIEWKQIGDATPDLCEIIVGSPTR